MQKPLFRSFWMKRHPTSPMPSQKEMENACKKALPDFSMVFSREEPSGNPRDGYVHGVTMYAQKGTTLITCDAGLWSSPNKELSKENEEQATYEIYSFGPRITSTETRSMQRHWKKELSEALAPYGFLPMTQGKGT